MNRPASSPARSRLDLLDPFEVSKLGGLEVVTEGVVDYCARRGIGFLAYSPTGGGRLNRKLPDHPVLQPMAARLRTTPHALVLAWVLARSPTVIVIPSARTVAHAQNAASAAEIALSEADLGAITAAEFSRA